MDENEVQALETQEQEAVSQEVDTTEVATDETINLSKSEYTKLKRQALAYQSTKGKEEQKPRAESSAPSDVSEKLTRLELKTEGYSNDEIETILEIGVDKLHNPVVQKAIQQMRQEKKSKEADVEIATKSAVYKKYSDQDLQNMSVEELRKILPHADN